MGTTLKLGSETYLVRGCTCGASEGENHARDCRYMLDCGEVHRVHQVTHCPFTDRFCSEDCGTCDQYGYVEVDSLECPYTGAVCHRGQMCEDCPEYDSDARLEALQADGWIMLDR